MNVRPTVFVSSTIRDLRDLRGAIKFWLEEMGFEVQLSEYTDFDRKPEAGALEACFQRIRECDYYLLLIGENVGTWFNEPERISVTRQEYRVARASFEETRRPKIISLVRDNVLTVLRERRTARSRAMTRSTLEDPEAIRLRLRGPVGRRSEPGGSGSRGVSDLELPRRDQGPPRHCRRAQDHDEAQRAAGPHCRDGNRERRTRRPAGVGEAARPRLARCDRPVSGMRANALTICLNERPRQHLGG